MSLTALSPFHVCSKEETSRRPVLRLRLILKPNPLFKRRFSLFNSWCGFFFASVFPLTCPPIRRWEGGDPGVSNQKTPTTILLMPDRKFHSFGYAARDFYHDLDPSESKQWLYLEKFKMKLHTTAVLPHSLTHSCSLSHSISHSLLR